MAAAEEFVERGYDAARVSAIARRAGLTSGAVYARWPNKGDVMVAALRYIFERMLPDWRLQQAGGGEMSPPTMMAALGAGLVVPDKRRDVLVQVFGSARNHKEIQECLQQYLDEDSEQLRLIVEAGKEAGLVDLGLSTDAMVLLCQAVEVGAYLLLSGGVGERDDTTEDHWNALLGRLIAAVAPPGSPSPCQ